MKVTFTLRTKTALLTDQLATRMFGGRAAALSQIIKIYGLEFTVIGTFHEKVETFGQSEVERDTILVPITVLRYFTPVDVSTRCTCRSARPRKSTASPCACSRSWRRGIGPARTTASIP